MFAAFAEFLAEAVLNLFLGGAPERPIWLRRLVQAFWLIVLGAVIAAVLYAIVEALR